MTLHSALHTLVPLPHPTSAFTSYLCSLTSTLISHSHTTKYLDHENDKGCSTQAEADGPSCPALPISHSRPHIEILVLTTSCDGTYWINLTNHSVMHHAGPPNRTISNIVMHLQEH
ncbi:hypothetical protein BDQ17DRAFT_1433892 [Cyathus striatus]|nr:hypothetical protein BDQ17DRAFT_1433892 [Cyathus striatus]